MFSELTKDITIFHIPNILQSQRAYDSCINVAVFLKIQMYKPIKLAFCFIFLKQITNSYYIKSSVNSS